MINSIFKLFILSFISFIFILSCSGGKNTISVEEYEKTENNLKKRDIDLQERIIEMLDLKNQIIILQSEVADLKDNIIVLHTKNDSLSFNLLEGKNDAKVLTERLDEAEMDKVRLRQNNSVLYQKVESNTDSMKVILEFAARQNYEKNIYQALDLENSNEIVNETSEKTKKSDNINLLPVKGVSPKLESSSSTPTSDKKNADKKDIDEKLTSAISPVMKLTKDEYQQRYQEALNIYFSSKYLKAIDEFSSLLASDKNSDYSDNCQYWIAESHYSLGNFAQALLEFKNVLNYKDSNKLDHALFKCGLSNIKLNNKNEGLRDFQTLIENYPESELVSKVRDILESDSF